MYVFKHVTYATHFPLPTTSGRRRFVTLRKLAPYRNSLTYLLDWKRHYSTL